MAHAGRVAIISARRAAAASCHGRFDDRAVSVDGNARLGYLTAAPDTHPADGIRGATDAARRRRGRAPGRGRQRPPDPARCGVRDQAGHAELAGEYLEKPFYYDGQLIVASYRWVRFYSMASLLEAEASVDAALEVRKALPCWPWDALTRRFASPIASSNERRSWPRRGRRRPTPPPRWRGRPSSALAGPRPCPCLEALPTGRFTTAGACYGSSISKANPPGGSSCSTITSNRTPAGLGRELDDQPRLGSATGA